MESTLSVVVAPPTSGGRNSPYGLNGHAADCELISKDGHMALVTTANGFNKQQKHAQKHYNHKPNGHTQNTEWNIKENNERNNEAMNNGGNDGADGNANNLNGRAIGAFFGFQNGTRNAIVFPIPRGLRPFRRLRIAQVSPLAESVPPKMYGGTERVVYNLTEELVRRGHQVTLFSSADSQTSAEMVSHPSWPAFRLNPVLDMTLPYQWMMEQVRRRANDFDILHFHTMEHLTIVHNFKERSVTTLHGLLSFPDMLTIFECFDDAPLVSISDDQRKHLACKPNFVATVHHGIPSTLLPFTANPSPNGTPYLAFLGRITDVKRPEWAIEIAAKAGIPLKIAAKVDKADIQHWEEVVKPLIEKHSDVVEYIGEINDGQKGEFLGNALALLFPIDWPEPFGLVMIESMACGTPVIARPCGSVSEVIEDGVSGIIFHTIEEGVEAAKRVHQLDRAGVRKAFDRRFTSEKMAENYLHVYEKMLDSIEYGMN